MSGGPLEAHLLFEREGSYEPAPNRPVVFTDQLQLAARGGCANFRVLERRRPGGQEVLVRHDFRSAVLRV
jgi:hypothetical protein